ncbi:MAG: hypothetical protein EOO80_08160 [Oxalobacteraceae bacterium]|nr:MAG: hypothetical protein EOO80_08160 [Oxalobacteraceae bacterium]
MTELVLPWGGAPRLETVSASYNKLTAIADAIGEAGALAVIDFSHNELTELPASMSDLKEKKIRELKLLPNWHPLSRNCSIIAAFLTRPSILHWPALHMQASD